LDQKTPEWNIRKKRRARSGKNKGGKKLVHLEDQKKRERKKQEQCQDPLLL